MSERESSQRVQHRPSNVLGFVLRNVWYWIVILVMLSFSGLLFCVVLPIRVCLPFGACLFIIPQWEGWCLMATPITWGFDMLLSYSPTFVRDFFNQLFSQGLWPIIAPYWIPLIIIGVAAGLYRTIRVLISLAPLRGRRTREEYDDDEAY